MYMVKNLKELEHRIEESLMISDGKPVILDEFLEDAIELDVDCLGDGQRCLVAGILEQIEEAGVHSGDSACVLPAQRLSPQVLERVKLFAERIVTTLKVKGFCNIQMAVKDDDIIVIEVNPRASRTIPFVSKAIGLPLAKLAALIQADVMTLEGVHAQPASRIAVKACVFPFKRFPLVDPLLNAEMKSTGETMAFGDSFAEAYLKASQAAGQRFDGAVLVDDCGKHTERIKAAFKDAGIPLVSDYLQAAFAVSTAAGETHAALRRKCVRDGKTCITSHFAALALAASLKEKPVFSLVALSSVHQMAATTAKTA